MGISLLTGTSKSLLKINSFKFREKEKNTELEKIYEQPNASLR